MSTTVKRKWHSPSREHNSFNLYSNHKSDQFFQECPSNILEYIDTIRTIDGGLENMCRFQNPSRTNSETETCSADSPTLPATKSSELLHFPNQMHKYSVSVHITNNRSDGSLTHLKCIHHRLKPKLGLREET